MKQISSVQSLLALLTQISHTRAWLLATTWTAACSSRSPRVYPNSCPLIRWCHPTISSSVIPFSSCHHSFPADKMLIFPKLISWHILNVKWSEIAQSCPTLCDLVDCSLPGSSVHGILQARKLEWVAISFSRVTSQPRDQTQVSRIRGRRFNLWATREAHIQCNPYQTPTSFLQKWYAASKIIQKCKRLKTAQTILKRP